MKKVSVHKLEVYGYHGCMPEEAIIGTHFLVDMEAEYDFTESAIKDDLTKTVDYVVLAKIAREEMAVRAKLIENVCIRIHQRIKKQYPDCAKITVTISKLNPPAGAEMERVSVTISE